MTRRFSFLVLLGLVLRSAPACACVPGDDPWSGTIADQRVACCARWNLIPRGEFAYVADVTLWCRGHTPRRSIHVDIFAVDPRHPATSALTTTDPAGSMLTRACRVGPHFRHASHAKRPELHQRRCCPLTDVQLAVSSTAAHGIAGIAGTFSCPRGPIGVPLTLQLSP